MHGCTGYKTFKGFDGGDGQRVWKMGSSSAWSWLIENRFIATVLETCNSYTGITTTLFFLFFLLFIHTWISKYFSNILIFET